jgi:hypothetical protein
MMDSTWLKARVLKTRDRTITGPGVRDVGLARGLIYFNVVLAQSINRNVNRVLGFRMCENESLEKYIPFEIEC